MRGTRTDWVWENDADEINIPSSEEALQLRFTTDAPATPLDEWADAIAHRGLPVPERKTRISPRIDEDVLAWFKNQEACYQARMNAVLKAYRDAHKSDEQG
ncbi:MAG: BrnA antitoxin family protein [Methylococcales bacterium]